jgi:hypothetical protein
MDNYIKTIRDFFLAKRVLNQQFIVIELGNGKFQQVLELLLFSVLCNFKDLSVQNIFPIC